MSIYRIVNSGDTHGIELTSVPEEVSGATPESLKIAVLFTTMGGTRAALRAAAELSRNLSAVIELVVVQGVPYPLPLTSPPVPLGFLERRLRTLASTVSSTVHVRIYLCRDKHGGAVEILRRPSLVFLAGRIHWWPTPECRLARLLQEHGHEVIMVKQYGAKNVGRSIRTGWTRRLFGLLGL